MPHVDTPQDKALNKGINVFAFLLVAVLLAPTLVRWGLDKKAEMQKLTLYENSPGCTTAVSSSPSKLPCTFDSDQVQEKHSIFLSYKQYPSHEYYYITVQGVKHGATKVRLIGRVLWDNLFVGETVSVKYWNGNPVYVSADGANALTSKNPIYQNRPVDPWGIAVVLGIVLWGVALAFHLWSDRRKGDASPTIPQEGISPLRRE